MFNDDAKELRLVIPHGTKGDGFFGYGFKTLKPVNRETDVYAVQL